MWNLVLVYLETVLVSVQDWCMVYAKCITGSEIGLDALDGLGDVGHVESRFGPFGGSVTLDAR
jgi:hypothetical protein